MGLGTLAVITTHTPLAAFVIALIWLRKRPDWAVRLVIAAVGIAVLGSLSLLSKGVQPAPILKPWLTSGTLELSFGFLLDGPSLLMGCIVSTVALCVTVYSVGYMSEEPSKTRFFAMLGLFTWAMLSFVYSASLLQAFIFWELVGLCSFFLIGFWYQKPSAVAAAKKAFLMTRIGDVALFIGLALLLQASGTLDIATINTEEVLSSIEQERRDLIAFLIFLGIVGKSAQFPLHTWLPDAMEGPTPVSALLHSATMVAAGVFLFARFHPLFLSVPDVLTIVLAIATFTAVLASTMALVATDIKRVLAYSSVSQLGYMLMGLAAGGFFSGMFHLTTHAAFKALLFLCAGAYIHHAHSNEMKDIGRSGARQHKIVTAAFLVGGLALAGIPPLSGFWSKELIIHQVSGTGVLIFSVGAYLGAFLTAYYTARMLFLVLRPSEETGEATEASAKADAAHSGAHHAMPWVMRGPIAFLGLLAALLGFAGAPLASFLGVEAPHLDLAAALPAVAVALSGLGLAWWEFGRKGAAQVGFVHRFPALARFFENRWYLDALYRKLFVAPVLAVARACYRFDIDVIDDVTDGVGSSSLEAGTATAQTQTGHVQVYVAIAVAVVSVVLLYLWWGPV